MKPAFAGTRNGSPEHDFCWEFVTVSFRLPLPFHPDLGPPLPDLTTRLIAEIDLVPILLLALLAELYTRSHLTAS